MPSEPSGNPGQLPDLDLRKKVALARGCKKVVPCNSTTLTGSETGKPPFRAIPAYDLDIAAILAEIKHRQPRRIELVYRDTGVTCIIDGVTGDGPTDARAACLAYLNTEADDAN